MSEGWKGILKSRVTSCSVLRMWVGTDVIAEKAETKGKSRFEVGKISILGHEVAGRDPF